MHFFCTIIGKFFEHHINKDFANFDKNNKENEGKMENLYLKWVNYKTNKKYVLGALCRDKENNKYYFKLNEDYLNKAKEAGFLTAILPFTDVNKIYESDTLFSMFKIRVPNIDNYNEEDIEALLEEVGLDEFDEFEFLKKTKGILMTDHFILEEDRDK